MPTSKNKKRFEDVLEILDNGINVMTAVNIQHLESLNDHVNRMTGIKVKETIPDKIIDAIIPWIKGQTCMIEEQINKSGRRCSLRNSFVIAAQSSVRLGGA